MYFLTRVGSFFCLIAAVMLAACGGGGSSADPGGSGSGGSAPESATISGALSFDRVLHNTFDSSLDYSNIQRRPIRNVVVEALSASGAVLASTTSDEAGNYSLTVTGNAQVRVRVKAQLLATGFPAWDFKVTDNTSGNALYVMDGELLSSGDSDSTRNLHAGSGWTGSRYGEVRVAAPFAILDSVYDAMKLVLTVNPQVVFPAAELRWSINNRPVENDINTTIGDLPTSFYSSSEGNIYLLGAENIDTDEYDDHLVTHEWGHYFEDKFSRSDSVGGSHSLGERLDIRVAFSEGWGNALSGMVSGDPFYRDALGVRQNSGFAFSVETNQFPSPGWFSEASVQTILYDIFDANSDGADNLSLGFAPIFDVLTSSTYRDQDSFTSIYSFIDTLFVQQPLQKDSVEALLVAEQINGVGIYGEGETNNGSKNVLPVYKSIELGASSVRVCSDQAAIGDGEYNKIENRRYLRVNIPTPGSYTFRAVRVNGLVTSDPDMVVYRNGVMQGKAESGDTNREEATFSLASGVHTVEVYEFGNIDEEGDTGGKVCFAVRVF